MHQRTFLARAASVTAWSLSTLAAVSAHAATLNVPSTSYANPCAAIAAAQPNDTILISPGASAYTDTCAITVAGLTLRGVNGMPKIDLSSGTPSGQKGIYVIDADGVTIENLELTGAQISSGSGENGAAIRDEASGLTVRGCYIHDNQDGILGSPSAPDSTVTIESTEFAHNGLGNGCDDGNGCTHNVYLSLGGAGYYATATFQYNWSHDLATDTADKGHLFKSRARQNFVLYNRLTGETDTDSYEIDLPLGGLAVIVGNLVEKPSMSGNGNMLSYAEEGLTNPDNRIFVVNNTFVNDKGGGNFLNITNGGVLVAHNNVFAGTGTPSSTGALSSDNLSGVDPLFVDQATFDYHLKAGSPAVGIGVAPGSADTFSLVPGFEYVQPVAEEARTDSGKTAGGYQYPSPVEVDGGASSSGSSSGPSGAGGAATSTSSSVSGAGGAVASTTSGAGSTASTSSSGAGGGSSSAPSKSSGCSCHVAGEQRDTSSLSALVLAFAVGSGLRLRRGARAKQS